jgi:hypothetical protein
MFKDLTRLGGRTVRRVQITSMEMQAKMRNGEKANRSINCETGPPAHLLENL